MKKTLILSIVFLILGAVSIGFALMSETPCPELEFPITNPDSIEGL